MQKTRHERSSTEDPIEEQGVSVSRGRLTSVLCAYNFLGCLTDDGTKRFDSILNKLRV